jgi:hypothetical protein
MILRITSSRPDLAWPLTGADAEIEVVEPLAVPTRIIGGLA